MYSFLWAEQVPTRRPGAELWRARPLTRGGMLWEQCLGFCRMTVCCSHGWVQRWLRGCDVGHPMCFSRLLHYPAPLAARLCPCDPSVCTQDIQQARNHTHVHFTGEVTASRPVRDGFRGSYFSESRNSFSTGTMRRIRSFTWFFTTEELDLTGN